jgi:hypothetical protein
VGIVALLLVLIFLGVSYWGASRVITQAGYARAWILVPLTPLVLTVVVFIMAYVDLRSFATSVPFGVRSTSFISNLSAVGTVWDIDRFTIFANWIFFLIFAFSRWPGALVVDGARPSSSPPGGSPQYGLDDSRLPKPSPGSSPSPMGATPSSPPHFQNVVGGERARDALTANATPAANAGAVRTKHCVWCGESLPGSRALFHDCGSKDRPATNCVACGAALSSEGAPCRACAPS